MSANRCRLVLLSLLTAVVLANRDCPIPRFSGEWEDIISYPYPAAEAQGGIVDGRLIVISGMTGDFSIATPAVYGLDLNDPCPPAWKEYDPFPMPEGITHASVLIHNGLVYVCGGYRGGHPGPHVPDCFVFNPSAASGAQWTALPSLPEGRGGGGLVLDSATHSLVFSGGAERVVENNEVTQTLDYGHTWVLNLNDLTSGWEARDDLPYQANHMSFVTARDGTDTERHFFLAGQLEEDVDCRNRADNYEWSVSTNAWIQRSNMPFTRGHASSSTRAASCGFLIAGGGTNEFGSTRDISYYDASADQWHGIGELPRALNSVVCDIDSDHSFMYCVTGHISDLQAYRRRIDRASFGITTPEMPFAGKDCPAGKDCGLFGVFCIGDFFTRLWADRSQRAQEFDKCGCNCSRNLWETVLFWLGLAPFFGLT